MTKLSWNYGIYIKILTFLWFTKAWFFLKCAPHTNGLRSKPRTSYHLIQIYPQTWWHSFPDMVHLLQSGKLSWQCCWQPVWEWSAERWIRSANEEHTPTWEGNYLGCNSWGKIKCDSSPRGVSHKITPEMFMKRESLLQNVLTAVCHLQVSIQSTKWMLWKKGCWYFQWINTSSD